MKDLYKRIDLLANIAIIFVAILLSIVLFKNYLFSNPSQNVKLSQNTNQPTNVEHNMIGTKLALPDIDWKKNGQTLILALSNTCHFCTESAPFYKRIAEERSNTRLIAALPQNVEEGERYLHNLNVSVDEVKQIPFDLIQVNGTPTLILVNSDGVVTASWVGKLPGSQESEVLNQL